MDAAVGIGTVIVQVQSGDVLAMINSSNNSIQLGANSSVFVGSSGNTEPAATSRRVLSAIHNMFSRVSLSLSTVDVPHEAVSRQLGIDLSVEVSYSDKCTTRSRWIEGSQGMYSEDGCAPGIDSFRSIKPRLADSR